jgi:DNA-binding transcriptional ArsR family regulator
MGLATPPVGPVTGPSCDAERAAAVMGALASPWRIEIVRLLADDELDVTDIAERLDLSVANTSHHLGRLRQAGLVISRRAGTRITNRLAGPHVHDLCAAACDTARDPAAAAPRPD